MENKDLLPLKLNSKEVLEKSFSANTKGYNSNEVDEFLDVVLSDYRNFEKFIEDLNKRISQLDEELKKTKKKLEKVELELVNYKNRFGNIKEGTSVTSENVDLLNKIGKYEIALRAHGIDPKKL